MRGLVAADDADPDGQPDNKAVEEVQALKNDQSLARSRELGRLSAQVERLITDASTLSTKVDVIQSEVTYVKGWTRAAILIIPIAVAAIIGLAAFFIVRQVGCR